MDAHYRERLKSPAKKRSEIVVDVDSQTDSATKPKVIFSDRCVPNFPKDIQVRYNLFPEPSLATTNGTAKALELEHTRGVYSQILQNELWGTTLMKEKTPTGSNEAHSMFTFSQKTKPADTSICSSSPMGLRSQQLLASPKKAIRKIPNSPFKVLEAPQIQDDFYLNLVDWSNQNLLAVGLDQAVYLWNASTSRVDRLCELPDVQVTSLAWMGSGSHIAIGDSEGFVNLWDVARQKSIRKYPGHKARVGSLSWAHSPRWLLSSGSRDRSILNRDVRMASEFISKFNCHKQEVCGLKWGVNPTSLLASGGNDNKLFLWEQRMNTERNTVHQPYHQYTSHKAAVKAITWSPHQRGLLASGGGTADQCIRFWNAVTSQELTHVDTGSQVCNLIWSASVNELVSTHGYSQNQISVWQYPSMTQIATLTGHTMRVLYLAMSPDGQTIVTGAGDETLRFWSVFPKVKVLEEANQFRGGGLNSFPTIR
jgi:cell division cycle 20-like protein 1 (cofactor of APC complex)